MTLSFDPDTLPLPVGHFIGGRLVPAEGVIDMHRPSDGKPYAGCPLADEVLVDRAVETAKKALRRATGAACGRASEQSCCSAGQT